MSLATPVSMLVFGPPTDLKGMSIWALEAVTETLAGALCNQWNMNQVENATDNAPSPVVFNGSPYCFYSVSNCLEYQYYNGTAWTQGTSISSVTQGASGPGATVFDNQIYLLFAFSNQLGCLTSPDGQTWSGAPSVLAGAVPQDSPSAVILNNSIYAFYHQVDTAAAAGLLWYVKFDGTTWGSPVQVPDVCMSGSPCAVTFTNPSGQTQTYIFYNNDNVGNAGQLWYVALDTAGQWQSPRMLSIENMTINGSPSAFVYSGQLYVVFASGTQTYQMVSSDASTYDLPIPFGQISMTGSPSVVTFNDGLICTGQSTSGGQLGYALTSPGGNWGFMYPAMQPSTATTNPTYMSAWPGTAVFNGTLYCFTQEANNGVYLDYSTFDGSSWSILQTVGDANMSYAPAPVVFNNNLYVFFNGGGWLYYYVSSDGTSWGNTVNVVNTGLSYNPVPVVFNDTLYVFETARSKGSAFWFNSMNTSGQWAGATEIPGLNNSSVPNSSYNGVCPPCAAVFNGELYLFYITSGWTIAYLKFNGGNSWDAPIAIPNYQAFTSGGSETTEYIGPTTGNMTAVTYNAPNGDATLAIYFVGYNTTNLYYMTTTDPSSAGNWTTAVMAGAPLPQGVAPPGIGTAVNWDVSFMTSTPGEWFLG